MAGARLLLWGGPFNSPSLNNEIVHGNYLSPIYGGTNRMVQNGKGSVCCESKGQMAPSLSEYFDCSEN